jgi:hypothetical protein
MSTMSDQKKETLKEKKEKLEAELEDIQHELDDSLDKVKSDVSSSLDPLEYVRRHPLPVVGLALLVGFLAGKEGGESPQSRNSTNTANHGKGSSDSDKNELASTLWYEIKRLATRKALSKAGDYIDDFFTEE